MLKKLFVAFTLFSWVCPARSQTVPQELAEKLQARLDSVYAARPYKAGLSAAIYLPDGALWTGAAGVSHINERTPVTPDHKFRLYSSTKPVTAALVLRLVSDGLISLEDSLSKFLPWIDTVPNLRGDVTVAQLLSHETGFNDYTNNLAFQIHIIANYDTVWAPENIVQHCEAPWFAPGQNRRYSSTNYILLGMIAEKVMNMPAADAFRQNFFEPLGLSEMYLSDGSEPAGTLAGPHDNLKDFGLTPDSITYLPFSYRGITTGAWTTGAVVSTARNLALWGRRLWGGNALPVQARSLMLNSLPPYGSVHPFNPERTVDDDFPGYGVFHEWATMEGFVGHGGASIGYRSVYAHHPEKNISIAICTNQGKGDLSNAARQLMKVVYDHLGLEYTGRAAAFAPALSVYPNPADGAFRVEATEPVNISVHDLAGRVVFEQSKTLGAQISPLAPGMYFVRAVSGNGGAATQRVVVGR